jgi:hypothetical protein
MASTPTPPPDGPAVPTPPDPQFDSRISALESYNTSLQTYFKNLGDVGSLLGGGTGGGGTTVPGGKNLDNCNWVQVWQNKTTADKDRTAEVDPMGGGQLPGTITVFYGPIPAKGAATPAGGPPPAPPAVPGGWPTIPKDGGSAGLTVPKGQALYVHYAQGANDPPSTKAVISQSA